MASTLTETLAGPEQLVEQYASRVSDGEQLTTGDILGFSRAVIDAHGITRGRQGGYASKKCPHHLAMDNMPATYPETLKRTLSSAQLDRMNSGNVFEDEIGAKVTGVPGVAVLIEDKDAEGNRTEAGKKAKEEATFAAYLDPEIRFIFNARMGGHFSACISAHLGRTVDDADRVSEPDAIELGPVMPNGLRAMRFVDVKWHKTTGGKSAKPTSYPVSRLDAPFFDASTPRDFWGPPKLEDWMQLAHYYRHGASLGVVDGTHSMWGAVIGKEEVLVWASLDDPLFLAEDPAKPGKKKRTSPLAIYDSAFEQALQVIDNALARDVDPRVPSLVSVEWSDDCKESEWKDVCLSELRAFGVGGHITLLPGITPPRAASLYEAGVYDIGSLAALDANDETLAGRVYQARTTLSGSIVRAAGVDVVGLDRADIEVDFDYEADDIVYQRGVRITRKGARGSTSEVVTYDTFTGDEADERDIFTTMWAHFRDLVEDAVERGRTIRFYHYSGYEMYADRRLAEKYAGQPGVPTVEEVEEFYTSDAVIDLYKVLPKDLVWPTMSHSIKELAKAVGFAWRDETPGGDESMVWYRNARAAQAAGDFDTAAEFIARLREYNEDDVEAQLALRDWVTAHGTWQAPGTQLPSCSDLPVAA